jgi:hypothetical protein
MAAWLIIGFGMEGMRMKQQQQIISYRNEEINTIRIHKG